MNPLSGQQNADRLLVYKSPMNWPLEESATGERKREFIRFKDRPTSFEEDFHCLERTLKAIVPKQEPTGCFLSPDEMQLPDKSDDHLGVAGMLAYYLSLTGKNPEWEHALSRAVVYQIDHLSSASPDVSGCYVRFDLKKDSPLDWCNTLWSLQGLNFILEHGREFLSDELYRKARTLGRDFWHYLTDYPSRDANPCHNQLLEYVSIGYTYGRVSERPEVCRSVIDYYRTFVRKLRVLDRGRWIYTEFNRWCAHYGLLSWCALEHLWSESRDPLFDKDANEMAAAFYDRLSAGGYYFGGTRKDEPGYEVFLYQLWYRSKVYDFSRVLLPEPSNHWRTLIFDGHNGRSLVAEMKLFANVPPTNQEALAPTEYTMKTGRCSVRLNEDTTARHISVNEVELIQANLPRGLSSPLIWREQGIWMQDAVLATPPPRSKGQSYCDVRKQNRSQVDVRATMQRGMEWEVRQWWISDGQQLQWVAQFFAHNAVQAEEVKYVFANPYLAQCGEQISPVSSIANGKESVGTYGPAQSLESRDYLRIGNQYVRSSHPLVFTRPSAHAFDGFPARNRKLWRAQDESNRIEITLFSNPKRFHFRESFFCSLEVGKEATPVSLRADSGAWEASGALGCFKSTEVKGEWTYLFQPKGGDEFRLLAPVFGEYEEK